MTTWEGTTVGRNRGELSGCLDANVDIGNRLGAAEGERKARRERSLSLTVSSRTESFSSRASERSAGSVEEDLGGKVDS